MLNFVYSCFVFVLLLYYRKGAGVDVPEVEGNMAYNMAYYCEIVNTMNV